MSKSAWGDSETEFFFSLTPDTILNEVEAALDKPCTGRVMALNSMENRVYEIELDLDPPPRNVSEKFVIAKFYRPGRWSTDQIEAEHEFLTDLKEHEIPAVAPLTLTNKTTLKKLDAANLQMAIFPKMGGRSPDELSDQQLRQVGRLLARMHNVGALKVADCRIKLTPETYGLENLNYIDSNKLVPENIAQAYSDTVKQICELAAPLFERVSYQRVHGDCHFGNLLNRNDDFFWIDFDDMVMGPCVQDLWLIIPGRDQFAKDQLNELIAAYEIMREFDHASLKLIEPLRALRYVHFAAWIAKRWHDPAFPKAFPYFGTEKYWREQVLDLGEQLELIRQTTHHQY